MGRLDDKTGDEIVWDGTKPLLPPRESKPSEVWTTPSNKRKYTWSGKYRKSTKLLVDNKQPSQGAEEHEENGNE